MLYISCQQDNNYSWFERPQWRIHTVPQKCTQVDLSERKGINTWGHGLDKSHSVQAKCFGASVMIVVKFCAALN